MSKVKCRKIQASFLYNIYKNISTCPAHLPPRMPRGYSFTHRWTSSVSASVIPVKSVPLGTFRRIIRFASSFMDGWRSGQQGATHAAPLCSVPHTPHLFYPAILPRFDDLASGGHSDPRALVYSLSWLDPGRKRPFSCEEINALDFGPGKSGEKKACRILLENGLIRFLNPDVALSELHTIQELKDLLRHRGLPVSGNKPVLSKRLADSGFNASVRDCRRRVLELTESGVGRVEESRLDRKQAYFLAVDALRKWDYTGAISAYRCFDDKWGFVHTSGKNHTIFAHYDVPYSQLEFIAKYH